MTHTSHIQLALVVLFLTSVAGCGRCGDAIICPSQPREDFPSSAIPAVRIFGGSLQFDAPRSLLRKRYHAIEKIYVYEAISGRIAWQIESPRGLKLSEKTQYDPKTPLIYGQPIEGTAVVVQPISLQIGKEYNMRGDFTAYDHQSVEYSEHIKVTFKLKRENGQLQVEQLPTKREG